MQAKTTSARNTASNPPHRYVAAVPSAAVAALNSDSRSNEITSAVGDQKAPHTGCEKPPEGDPLHDKAPWSLSPLNEARAASSAYLPDTSGDCNSGSRDRATDPHHDPEAIAV